MIRRIPLLLCLGALSALAKPTPPEPAARTIILNYDADGRFVGTTEHQGSRSTERRPPPPRSIDVLEVAPLVDRQHARATLVVLHASWCPASGVFLPEVARLAERYRSRGLAVVALSIDEDEPSYLDYMGPFAGRLEAARVRPWRPGELVAALARLNIPLPSQFKVPTWAILGPHHRLAAHGVGGPSKGQLDRVIARLLAR